MGHGHNTVVVVDPHHNSHHSGVVVVPQQHHSGVVVVPQQHHSGMVVVPQQHHSGVVMVDPHYSPHHSGVVVVPQQHHSAEVVVVPQQHHSSGMVVMPPPQHYPQPGMVVAESMMVGAAVGAAVAHQQPHILPARAVRIMTAHSHQHLKGEHKHPSSTRDQNCAETVWTQDFDVHGRCRFRSCTGEFVGVDHHGHVDYKHPTSEDVWFQCQPHHNGVHLLRSHHGYYLSIGPLGKVKTESHPDQHCEFIIHPLEQHHPNVVVVNQQAPPPQYGYPPQQQHPQQYPPQQQYGYPPQQQYYQQY